MKFKVIGWYSTNPHNEHVVPFARVVYVEASNPEEGALYQDQHLGRLLELVRGESQVTRYLAIIRIVADTIRDLGEVPSGHLYARLMEHMSLETYQGTSVPKDFSTYLSRKDGKESHYGDTPTTPYGEPLECVTVGQIIDALNRKGFWDMSSKDLAVNAYLQQLTKETRIALYWH